MTLTEYINETLKAYNLKFKASEIEGYLYDKAREVKKGNCAVVDDETVKEWIINYDPEKRGKSWAEKAAEKKATEEEKVEQPKPEKKVKPKKEEKKDDQINIFDFL